MLTRLFHPSLTPRRGGGFQAILLACLAGPLTLPAQEWIWHDGGEIQPNERRVFRKEFVTTYQVASADLVAAGYNEIEVFINGKSVARSDDWQKPARADVVAAIRTGRNVIAVRGKNDSGAAAILLKLKIRYGNLGGPDIVTDKNWISSDKEEEGWEGLHFKPEGWTKARSFGKLGVEPWGNILPAKRAVPVEELSILDGFEVELLHSATEEEGSWVCMTVDNQGRFIISPDPGGLLRVTWSPGAKEVGIERLNLEVHGAQGLLHALDSLYISGEGPDGPGIYRLTDDDGDDRFDHTRLLKKFSDGGDHGPHAIVLGPDKKLYYMNGNRTKPPEGISPFSPYRNYGEDHLLPQAPDPRGHNVGVTAPGGYVARSDPDGENWELMLAGFRNAYDLAFNAEGEMFTYDSDMEWDWGAPWYRPTRILHCVSGGEYGWRNGSGKWPDYYADSLPSVIDVGIGSPTGVKFGTQSHFPDRYRKAFYAHDWTYGRILAIHLSPEGASYTGSIDTLLQGRALNVTDLEFGPDGAMYFITGGWRKPTGLYRVSWSGSPDESRAKKSAAPDAKAAKARALRRRLESLHGEPTPGAVDLIWPHLDSPDRWIRYAARIAIEAQDPKLWKNRALGETRTNASLTALLALARVGDASLHQELTAALLRRLRTKLTEEQNLTALRALDLVFIRMGRPESGPARSAIDVLLSLQHPSGTVRLNQELTRTLVYLEAPEVIGRALDLLEAAPTQEDRVQYLFLLRNVKSGWTLEQRRRYFAWFNLDRKDAPHSDTVHKWFADVGRAFNDGASFPRYFANIRKVAAATLSETETRELADLLKPPETFPAPARVAREFVANWTMEMLVPELDRVDGKRSLAQGREAYLAAQCHQCHRFNNEGGDVGPDLTGVASRFNRHDLLESILEPSKTVSDLFQDTTFLLHDGEEVTGRIIQENGGRVIVEVGFVIREPLILFKKDIASRQASTLSPMPQGLVGVLTKDDMLDLLAYLESGMKAPVAKP